MAGEFVSPAINKGKYKMTALITTGFLMFAFLPFVVEGIRIYKS